ncbi:hypothetical protein CPB97_001601 [Podila verticillata]|nr:hypothetical protein CPB97_001601 [Podila verticillata]
MVPALMTYCEVPLMEDEEGQKHSVRIHYRTWVLKPIRWVIHKDHDGLCAFIGNETPGQFTVEMETEEDVKFSSCIEFSAAVSAAGGYGPVMGSVGLKTSIGAGWEKTCKVTTRQAMIVEQGCSYQPTRIYAKLLCKVVHAKAGEFLANGFGELVTTNKCHEPVAANHKASNSTYVRPVTDLRRLYDAFGKEVSISRKERGFLWSKVISIKIKIKVVVDPADGRLYVTGAASRFMNHKILPARFSRWRIRSRMAANERSVVVLVNGLGSLRDYRGLCAKDSMPEDKVISYSPGGLVKVWKVATKRTSSPSGADEMVGTVLRARLRGKEEMILRPTRRECGNTSVCD